MGGEQYGEKEQAGAGRFTGKRFRQKYAGHRKETVYQSVTMPHGEMSAVPPVPMEVMAGGAAVFIVSLDDIRKF